VVSLCHSFLSVFYVFRKSWITEFKVRTKELMI